MSESDIFPGQRGGGWGPNGGSPNQITVRKSSENSGLKCTEEESWIDMRPQKERAVAASSSSAPLNIVPIWNDHSTTNAVERDYVAELEELRQVIEDKEFALLEMQSAHLQDIRYLQDDLDEKDERIRSLESKEPKHNVSTANAEALAMQRVVATERENERLREQVEHLQVQLVLALPATPTTRALDPVHARVADALHETRAALRTAEARNRNMEEEAEAWKAELYALQVHTASQSSKIRTLSDQLSLLLQQNGNDAVRAEAAEHAANVGQEEAEKRTAQVHKLVEALTRVKNREAAGSALLDAQESTLSSLQTALIASQTERDRWRAAVDVLQEQHGAALDRCEALAEALASSQARAADEAEAVRTAVASSESVKALSIALEAAIEERGRVEGMLADTRAESRSVCFGLQRRCDEQSNLICALQADLSSALAAVSMGGDGDGVGGQRGGGGGASHSAPASAFAASERTRTQSGRGKGARRVNDVLYDLLVQEEGGKEDDAPSSSLQEASFSAEVARLRLQCEGLSRRLAASEERVHDARTEQDDLVEVNERLRTALDVALPTIADTSTNGHAQALEAALKHADSILKRRGGKGGEGAGTHKDGQGQLQRAGAAEVSLERAGCSHEGLDLRSQVHACTFAIQMLMAHAVKCETAALSTSRLLCAVHGLVSQVRGHMERSEGEGGAWVDPILQAQLIRLEAPSAEVLAGDRGRGEGMGVVGQGLVHHAEGRGFPPLDPAMAGAHPVAFMSTILVALPLPLPPSRSATLADPGLLRTLVDDCTGQVEGLRAELGERAAAELGQACVTQ